MELKAKELIALLGTDAYVIINAARTTDRVDMTRWKKVLFLLWTDATFSADSAVVTGTIYEHTAATGNGTAISPAKTAVLTPTGTAGRKLAKVEVNANECSKRYIYASVAAASASQTAIVAVAVIGLEPKDDLADNAANSPLV